VQRAAPPVADLAAAARAVRSADSAYAAAAAARDLERSVAGLTRDGIMFVPGHAPVIGRAAVREHMRQAFATPHFSVTWTTDTVVVAASGDMAYSFARSRFTFPGHSGAPGAVDTAYGKGVRLWRRDGGHLERRPDAAANTARRRFRLTAVPDPGQGTARLEAAQPDDG
jgi:uncharacterized protein (TIGR02246 family)